MCNTELRNLVAWAFRRLRPYLSDVITYATQVSSVVQLLGKVTNLSFGDGVNASRR